MGIGGANLFYLSSKSAEPQEKMLQSQMFALMNFLSAKKGNLYDDVHLANE